MLTVKRKPVQKRNARGRVVVRKEATGVPTIGYRPDRGKHAAKDIGESGGLVMADVGDFMHHTSWSADLAQQIGSDRAKELQDAHEIETPTEPAERMVHLATDSNGRVPEGMSLVRISLSSQQLLFLLDVFRMSPSMPYGSNRDERWRIT